MTGQEISEVMREQAYRLAWCGLEMPVMDEQDKVLLEDLKDQIIVLRAENREFRERESTKAHQLYLAKQRIAELEAELGESNLGPKNNGVAQTSREIADAAVGRIARHG